MSGLAQPGCANPFRFNCRPADFTPASVSAPRTSMPTGLFTPFEQRGLTLRNRVVVSPMCQYSCRDGHATDWHLVHLGSRAVGGAGAVIAEAAAVSPEGRISPADLGVWQDSHVEPLARVFRFLKEQGAVPGIQLAHAGRKASTDVPWRGGGVLNAAQGGWDEVVAPSALPFKVGHHHPLALDQAGIDRLVAAFAAAAGRMLAAGAEIIELHAAHGYLLHQFLSPLSNRREDGYGGSFANRTRLAKEVVAAVREVWPERLPLWLRLSATDWVEGGWSPAESVQLARELVPLGVDLIDCSSGGAVPDAVIPVAPGFQVQFAAQIRREAGLATGAVGLITEPQQADDIIRQGQADVVLLAREFLRQPQWPLHAARTLGETPPLPRQYERGF
jgi:2,4-dienoyl-CoA reductase-like NADH-dependent reductase (Old Yellow Enzyme family)